MCKGLEMRASLTCFRTRRLVRLEYSEQVGSGWVRGLRKGQVQIMYDLGAQVGGVDVIPGTMRKHREF